MNKYLQQTQIEVELKDMRINKFLSECEAVEKKGNVELLPEFSTLQKKVYKECEKFLADAMLTELTKRRKKNYYTKLLLPAEGWYEAAVAKAEKKVTTACFTPVNRLVPYLMSTVLLKAAITSALDNSSTAMPTTEAAEIIRKRLYTSYNLVAPQQGTDNDVLAAIVELIKGYAVQSNYINEVAYKDTLGDVRGTYELHIDTRVIVLNPAFNVGSEDAKTALTNLRNSMTGTLNTYHPMIVKPTPHFNLIGSEGGYLVTPSPLLRKTNRKWNSDALVNFNAENNPEWFAAINERMSTPFKINTKLLDFLGSAPKELLKEELPSVEEAIETKEKLAAELFPQTTELFKEVKQLNSSYSKYHKKAVKAREEGESEKANLYLDKAKAVGGEKLAKLKLIEDILAPFNEYKSIVGRAYAEERLQVIIEKYKHEPELYFPLFVGDNGRVYYYCSDLSPQGSNKSKALIHSAEEVELTEEGFEQLCIALGTMFKGYDKKTNQTRLQVVKDNHTAIMNFIGSHDSELLSLIDMDEYYCAVALAIEYYNYHTIKGYKTGVLTYIDATSSAIQIQGLIQKCEACAKLTNLTGEVDGDNLPDAYVAVANMTQDLLTDLATMDDAMLYVLVQAGVNNKNKLIV